jgi:probable phosphoglycerate mutase
MEANRGDGAAEVRLGKAVTTRFIVVRHGETYWNAETRIQGQLDSDLNEEGVAQAEAVGARVSREPFDVLVSSDLGRAVATAQRISDRTGKPIELDAALRERCFGCVQGMLYAEADQAHPGAFARFRDADPDYVLPGGESRRAFHHRIRDAFDALAARHSGRTVVVVTHGGALATLYRHIRGIALDAAHPVAIANAAYNVLVHDGTRWSIEAWSDRGHLDGAEAFEED